MPTVLSKSLLFSDTTRQRHSSSDTFKQNNNAPRWGCGSVMLTRTWPWRPRTGPRTWPSKPRTEPRIQASRPRTGPSTKIWSLRTTMDQNTRTTSLVWFHVLWNKINAAIKHLLQHLTSHAIKWNTLNASLYFIVAFICLILFSSLFCSCHVLRGCRAVIGRALFSLVYLLLITVCV